MSIKDKATSTKLTVQNNELSDDQKIALQKFANKHGRVWKMRLSTLWSTGTDVHQQDGALLRQIRNSFGPAWLYSKQNTMKSKAA